MNQEKSYATIIGNMIDIPTKTITMSEGFSLIELDGKARLNLSDNALTISWSQDEAVEKVPEAI